MLELDGGEARLLTLLSVAYGRPVGATALNAIRRASKRADAGDDAMAAMHIALAGLGELSNPADVARRLFIADGLLAKGVSPRDIFAALEFDPAALDELEKFDPDEPRNPKGSGRISGEWTREVEEAVEEIERQLPRFAPRVVAAAGRAAAALAAVASDALPPIVFFGALLIPFTGRGTRNTGQVRGHPDLYYSWNSDETELKIVRQSDNKEILSAVLDRDGTLRSGAKRIGRKRGDEVVIEPFAWPPPGPESDTDDRPRLCPKDTPDKGGRPGERGEKDKDYEDYMKRFVNPDMPTKRGFAYLFTNPLTRHSAMIDDCKQTTGDPWEAKGTGYAKMLAKKVEPMTDNLDKEWVEQAVRQLNASPGHELHWCFAEKETADHVERLFKEFKDDRRLAGIEICRLYWKERMR